MSYHGHNRYGGNRSHHERSSGGEGHGFRRAPKVKPRFTFGEPSDQRDEEEEEVVAVAAEPIRVSFTFSQTRTRNTSTQRHI